MGSKLSGIILGGLVGFSLAVGNGHAQAVPPADTTSYMVTDFESPEPLNTPLYGYWFNYTDQNSSTAVDSIHGNSTLTSFDSTGAYFRDTLGYPDARTFPRGHTGDSGTHCLRFGYALGNRSLSCGGICTYPPYVGFGVTFTTNADTLDLTGATSISFWAKADTAPLALNTSFATVDTTTNASDYGQAFTIDTTWKLYSITLKPSVDFKQPSYSAHKPFELTHAKGLGFNVSAGGNAAHLVNGLLIDDVSIQNWKYVDPTITDRVRPLDPARGQGGIRIRKSGNLILVSLPEAYRHKSGSVQAVDAHGRVLARTGFAPNAGTVSLGLAGSETRKAGTFIRVIVDRISR